MSEYNYESFPLDMEMSDFDRWPRLTSAGERAPDGILVDATDGSEVALSSVWRRGPLVVEFGSLT